MITPLQPRAFFRGQWSGEGELRPMPIMRPFIAPQAFRFFSHTIWLTDTIWTVHDRFEFASGRRLEHKMFAELIAPNRIHLTADHMPGGADIELFAEGFRFTPYQVLGAQRDGGRAYRLTCFDECRLDAQGYLHDTIRMQYFGLPVATMRIGPIELNRD